MIKWPIMKSKTTTLHFAWNTQNVVHFKGQTAICLVDAIEKTGFSATQPTEPKQVQHYIHLFQLLRQMDLTQRNISRSCFQSQRGRFYCLGLKKAEVEYNMIRYVNKNLRFKDEWIWPCRDSDPLQGLIFFGRNAENLTVTLFPTVKKTMLLCSYFYS